MDDCRSVGSLAFVKRKRLLSFRHFRSAHSAPVTGRKIKKECITGNDLFYDQNHLYLFTYSEMTLKILQNSSSH